MKIKRYLAAALTILMLGNIFAGCGSNSSDQSEAQKTANEAPSSAVEHVDPVVAEAMDETVQRNVVNVAVQNDPSDWGPFASGTNGRTQSLNGIYELLGEATTDGIKPCLAKEWSFSEDGLTLTVTLYDYIHDSEGNPFDSSDYVFCWNTCTEMGKNGARTSFTESVEAVDPYTIAFHFKRSLALGELETLFKLKCVTQEAYEASEDGMSSHPVATGPYVLSSYTPNYMFTYVKNENYWQTDDALVYQRQKSNVNTINYYIISESAQRTMALETGSCDMCNEISADDLPMFEEGGSLSDRFWVAKTADNLTVDLVCNADASRTTNDVNLRKAIFYAVNAAVILESVWKGDGEVVHSIVPSWSVGYQEKWNTEDNYYQHDMEKAKEYLAASNYSGEKLVILVENNANLSSCAQLVQSFIGSIGIDSELSVVDSAVINEYVNDVNWDITINMEPTSVYAGLGFTKLYLASSYPNGGNMAHWADSATLNQLLDQARMIETSSDETLDAFHQYVIENALGMGLVNFNTSYVVPNWVSSICLSEPKTMVPGGFTYTEE